MPGDEVRLSGFKELDAALGEMKKATERRVLRKAAVEALQPFVEEAKRLVPVDEGTLRDSITAGSAITKNARRADRGDPPEGVRVYAGTANRNGVPREFGSHRSAAEPFMRPAWESKSGEVLDRAMTSLGEQVDKAAKRAARKG